MIRADSVHSTPPTNTPIDTTRRGFLGGTAAALAAGTAVNVAALATMPPAAAASDPIYASIEAHKAVAVALVAAVDRNMAFENELHANERLQRDRRLPDEQQRGKEIEEALSQAYSDEADAAIELLGIYPTTVAGAIALLTYARDYDNATFGMGWPIDLIDDTLEGTRNWHSFLIANLVEVLPDLLPVSA